MATRSTTAHATTTPRKASKPAQRLCPVFLHMACGLQSRTWMSEQEVGGNDHTAFHKPSPTSFNTLRCGRRQRLASRGSRLLLASSRKRLRVGCGRGGDCRVWWWLEGGLYGWRWRWRWRWRVGRVVWRVGRNGQVLMMGSMHHSYIHPCVVACSKQNTATCNPKRLQHHLSSRILHRCVLSFGKSHEGGKR